MSSTVSTPAPTFDARQRTALLVMAGGILLFATNVYLTTSLLPTAVAEIGGRDRYAWVMTGFLLAAVVSSLSVARLLTVAGARTSYTVASALFGAGSLICALAPDIDVLVGGRVVQGLGGGMLAGLAMGVIRQALPVALHGRALGVVSAMWGVGNLAGPTIGGLLAQVDQWRWAFGLLVVGTLTIWLLAQRSMPRQQPQTRGERPPVPPATTIALFVAAAALVSVAGVLSTTATVVLLALGAVLLAAFVARERRATTKVLPGSTYRSGHPLKWVYLGLALLGVASTVETFLPLFGQELGDLGPFRAGLLGASLSVGWSAGAISSSRIDDEALRARLRMAGPAVLAVGLALYAATQQVAAGPWTIALWAALLIGSGAGLGIAFQFGITAAMGSTSGDEATAAATGASTVQLMSNAIGAALAGVAVHVGGPAILGGAHLLAYSFAVVAALGVAVMWRANRLLAGTVSDDVPDESESQPELERSCR